ncbi:MAG TPA: hypothetical protein VE086_05890 [Chthoniobacterales bacterium]|nr:hypothetical protein [Chthoniobacterales bacterium]
MKIEGLTLGITRNPAPRESSSHIAWSLLAHLQADNFNFSAVNLHIENDLATVDVHDGALTGSELEAGTLTAHEITIAAPWLHKTFANLRGATSWQENRLSLGALSLVRGLDIDTITIDLSQIGDSRVGMEVSLDAFGGKVRARISSDDRGGKRTWDVAGNGAGVSLAQMSDAFEWTNRASGSIHASKFTFRGELNDLRNATAALWAEISGLTWRDRTADTVMIGASLYNRAIQVEQLYIKQRNNQLTLTGEFGWPEKFTSEFQPVFRGDLSASINDLGEFVRLFGWSPPDFAGQLSANGSVSAREGKLGGHISVTGNSLILFRSPIESLEMKLDLEESKVTITQFELRQTGDFFHGEGNFALTADHTYSGAFQTSVAQIANYRGFIPSEIMPWPLEGSVSAKWKGRGANDSGSGTFQAHAKNLRATNGPLAPFDVDLEADYSPESIFFRQFHFWNEHADLSAFVGIAKNYIQAQGLRFDLNGNPRVYGNVFAPISVRKLREGSSWLASLSADPFFDVDLTVDALDLTEFAAAVKTKPDLSGQANGKLQLSGVPGSLQGKSEIHLRDFVLDNSPPLSADLEASLAFGMASLKTNVTLRSSSPVNVEASVPIRLEKHDAEYVLASNGPLSATVNFPTLLLANVPSFIAPGVFTRGILSGNLNVADSVQHPLTFGSVDLVDGQLLRGSSISAGISFKGRNATIDFAHLKERDADISAHGEIAFENISDIRLSLSPSASLTPVMALTSEDCVSDVAFHTSPAVARVSGSVDQINLRGNLTGSGWTISLRQEKLLDSENADLIFPLCRDGKTLSLGLAPSLFP